MFRDKKVEQVYWRIKLIKTTFIWHLKVENGVATQFTVQFTWLWLDSSWNLVGPVTEGGLG